MEKILNENKLPTIALIGRANVGKSTLFNKLIEEKKALVSDIAGTTRTNNEGNIIWRGKEIHVIDTGGLETSENERFTAEIIEQSQKALTKADIIVLMADAQIGVLPQEKDLAKQLRNKYKGEKTILLVANKVDNQEVRMNLGDKEWSSLQLGQPLPVSASNGSGIGDLLDAIYQDLNKHKKRPKKIKEEQESIRVSLVGKPNVGKSSLFNKLIGQEKAIVSDIAHTTREPFDTEMIYKVGNKKHNIIFVDTAGIRRKAHVEGILEREGIQKTIQAIEKSDIILLALDGSESISSQDMQLGGLVERRSKSVVILINKWDLAEDTDDSMRNDVKKMVYAHFPHLDFAPLLFVSGKTGYRTQQIFPLIIKISQARKTEIPQHVLDKFIEQITREHKPSRGKGTRQPKILGFRQVHNNPPIFDLLIKHRTSIHRSYTNYIENKLREQFNFIGTPIVIKLTKTKK